MSKVPRTLLISHFPVGKRNGSAQHLLAAMERFPSQMVWYSTKPPAAEAVAEAAELPVPYAHGHLPTRPSRQPFKSLRIHFTLGLWARKLGREAARFGKQHGVELVWGALNLEAVEAAREAARVLGVPLAVTTFDDPPSLLRYYQYPSYTQRVFEQNFERTIAAARSHGVISSAMGDDYRQRYGVDPRVLYLGVDPEDLLEPFAASDRNEPFIIGSVGSAPSVNNWQLMIEAVAALNRRLGRTALRILHVGTLRDELRHPDVEVTGWVTGEELKHHLGRLSAGILPIWFEEEFAYSARTAFPTKIEAFLQSQRPIVAFGPADSLVVRMVAQDGLGITCTSANAENLADAFHELLFDDVRYHEATLAMAAAASTYSRPRYFEAVEAFLRQAVDQP